MSDPKPTKLKGGGPSTNNERVQRKFKKHSKVMSVVEAARRKLSLPNPVPLESLFFKSDFTVSKVSANSSLSGRDGFIPPKRPPSSTPGVQSGKVQAVKEEMTFHTSATKNSVTNHQKNQGGKPRMTISDGQKLLSLSHAKIVPKSTTDTVRKIRSSHVSGKNKDDSEEAVPTSTVANTKVDLSLQDAKSAVSNPEISQFDVTAKPSNSEMSKPPGVSGPVKSILHHHQKNIISEDLMAKKLMATRVVPAAAIVGDDIILKPKKEKRIRFAEDSASAGILLKSNTKS